MSEAESDDLAAEYNKGVLIVKIPRMQDDSGDSEKINKIQVK